MRVISGIASKMQAVQEETFRVVIWKICMKSKGWYYLIYIE